VKLAGTRNKKEKGREKHPEQNKQHSVEREKLLFAVHALSIATKRSRRNTGNSMTPAHECAEVGFMPRDLCAERRACRTR
jgi:hypothetical protein